MSLYDITPVLIGAGITWLVSWLYYKKAGDKLRQEATELRRLTNLILHSLENAELVDLAKDVSGRPTGITVKVSGVMTGEGRILSKGEVTPRKSPNHNMMEASDVDNSKNSG